MDCDHFEDRTALEERIALHVEGDLNPSEARRLEQHLRTCASCRAWADEIAASQQALRRHMVPPEDEEVFESIRQGVLQATGTRVLPMRRRMRRVGPWLALAATLILAVGLWRMQGPAEPLEPAQPITTPILSDSSAPEPQAPPPTPEPPTPEPPAPEPPIPEPPIPEPPIPEPSAPEPSTPPLAPEPPKLPRALSSEAPPTMAARLDTESMLIKMVSEDNDIVIYWLVDPTENKETEHESETVL